MRNGGLQQQFTFGDSGDPPEISVTEFARRLSGVFKKISLFDRILIRGEISDWSPQTSGHLYFTLKDSNAILKCFAFASDTKQFPEVRNGLSVIAIGSVRIWEQRSIYQLQVKEIRLVGIGALAAQVEALRQKFEREGLFSESRKRQLPRFPYHVALVSARGKGAEDFEGLLKQKAPNVRVTFIQTRVQGDGAEIDIATAIDKASSLEVDVIVLTRGGGSYEELFPFNLEPVVRAITRAKHPVLTAIGHLTHHHLADDVADIAFATPTAAVEAIAHGWSRLAELLLRSNKELDRGINDVMMNAIQGVDSRGDALQNAIYRVSTQLSRRLQEYERALERNNPVQRLYTRAARFSQLRTRFEALPAASFASYWRALDRQNQRFGAVQGHVDRVWSLVLERAESRLEAENPTRPLERGFAIVSNGGRTLRDAAEVAPGDAIVAKLWRGTLDARVERVSDDG